MDLYQRLANGIQARRRSIEGIDSAISTAIGIRADLLPHQLAVVRRVLTDTSIRHLLADEVGLGKTIEALMIINAYKTMTPGKKVAIVVPNAKYQEWQENEIFGRSHDAPAPIEQLLSAYAESLAPHERRNVFLFSPSLEHRDFLDETNSHLLLPQVLEPSQFGLVVVDEVHNLTNAIRSYLVRNAARFDNLLLLSATPRLADPARRLEVLALLEPQLFMAAFSKAQRSGSDAPTVWHDFSRWTRSFADAFFEATGNDPSVLHRRIIRTKRAVLRDESLPKQITLPQRTFRCERIPPNENESRINDLALQIIRGGHAGFDREAFARRVCVGAASLRDAIGDRRRVGNVPEHQLAELQLAVSRNRGADSRLDALTVELLEVWCTDPTEKVVVACNDVPTIDYLSAALRARLPSVGQVSTPTRLTISTLRDDSRQSVCELKDFTAGGAHLLLANVEAATVGLNLQMAKTLIFYSTPLTVEEIDQWIGRLDRIGSCAVTKSCAQPSIRVIALTLSEHFDDTVCAHFARHHVFEESIDAEDVQRSSYLNGVASQCVLGEGEAADDNTDQCNSLSIQGVSLEECKAAYSVAMQLQPQQPALMSAQVARRPWVNREIACEQWLRSLKLSKEYDYRTNQSDANDPSVVFRTLWYQSVVNDATVLLPEVPDVHPYSPEKKQAFETRRPAIQIRPRTAVLLAAHPSPVPLQLQFFSHGGRLHDALVKAWSQIPADSGSGFWFLRVRAQVHHPAALDPGCGRYMVTFGWLDSGNLPTDRMDWEHAADARWIRDILNGCALLYVERLGSSRTVLEPAAAINLLTPFVAREVGDPPQQFYARITTKENQAQFMSGPDYVAGWQNHRQRFVTWARQRAHERWSPVKERILQAGGLRVASVQRDHDATATQLRHAIDIDEQRLNGITGPETRLTEGRIARNREQLAQAEDAFNRRRRQIEHAVELIDDPPVHIHTSFLLEVDVVP